MKTNKFGPTAPPPCPAATAESVAVQMKWLEGAPRLVPSPLLSSSSTVVSALGMPLPPKVAHHGRFVGDDQEDDNMGRQRECCMGQFCSFRRFVALPSL